MYTISIEDLVTNAFIEVLERTNKRTLYISQVIKYERAIKEEARRTNLPLFTPATSRNWANNFIDDYCNWFTMQETENDVKFKLKDGITSDKLRKQFRVRLPLAVLKVCVSESVVKELLA